MSRGRDGLGPKCPVTVAAGEEARNKYVNLI